MERPLLTTKRSQMHETFFGIDFFSFSVHLSVKTTRRGVDPAKSAISNSGVISTVVKCCVCCSYSEEVWRGRACASPVGSASSREALEAAAGGGDQARRRTRSAEFPSLTYEVLALDHSPPSAVHSKSASQKVKSASGPTCSVPLENL